MKRSSDGGYNRTNKRFRSGGGGGGGGGGEEPALRLLIPSKIAGSIIGKGGKNISKLRSEYTATIQVPDCSGPERVISITSDIETAIQIVQQIIPCLEEFPAYSKNKEVELRLLVHHSLAGCVIGKAGSKVKELREKTSAKIKIYGNCCPQSTDRVVSIIGAGDVAINGIRAVIDLLRDTPPKGYTEHYDPTNFDEEYCDDYGGFGTPGGGGGGGRHGGSGGPMWGGGPRGGGNDSFGPPPRGGDNYRNSRFGRDSGGGGGGGGGGGRRGGNDGGQRSSRVMDDSKLMDVLGRLAPAASFRADNGPRPLMGSTGPAESTQVTVPKELAGAIIGKGGSRIRRVRSESGAEVTIDEPAAGASDRVITIKGTQDQIQYAQYLLQQAVRESQETSY